MNTKVGRLQYQDALFLVLVLIVGASLLLGVLFAAHVRGRWYDTEVESIRYADRAARAEVAATVMGARAALIEALGAMHTDQPDAKTLGELLRDLAASEGFSEWLVLSSRDNRLWNDDREWVLEAAVVEEFAGDSPELIVLKQPTGSTLWMLIDETIAEGDAILIRVPPELLTVMRGGSANGAITTVLDQHATVIARLVPAESSPSQVDTYVKTTGIVDADGLVPPSMRAPYLGSMNRYLPLSDEPTTVRHGDTVHSLVPLESLDAFLVVERKLIGAAEGFALSTTLVGSAAVLLYGVITWLFLGFRRSVGDQARAIAELSEQKNLLFGLLSHNLKNHLAAIAAETYALPSSGQTLSSVEAASRVISDSLYYLQLREGTFQTPPVESVEAEDIIEFLRVRGEREAAIRHVTLARGVVESTTVATNLSLALEALERALFTVLELAELESTITIGFSADGRTADGRAADGTAPTCSIRYTGGPIAVERLAALSANLDCDESRVPRSNAIADLGLWVCREMLWRLGASMSADQIDGDLRYLSISFPPADVRSATDY